MSEPVPAAANAQYFRVQVPSILDRPYWDGIARDATYAPLREKVLSLAAAAPRYPSLPHGSDYLAMARNDDRSVTDRYHQQDRFTLAALCFRRCLRGLDESDRDDQLLDWLWAHLTHVTWGVGDMHPQPELPAIDTPQIDLAGCEMAANLAETREALLPWLNSVSGTLSQRIVDEIDARVLTPFLRLDNLFWMEGKNNWTGVCAGSILGVCESLAAQGFPRPEARAKAIQLLQRYFERGFTPHGECEEGIGYWRYGLQMTCVGLSRLSPQELWRDLDRSRVVQVASYPGHVHLFAQTFFTSNDGHSDCPAAVSFVPWLAAATGDDFLARWAGDLTDDYLRNFSLLIRAVAGMHARPNILDPMVASPPGAHERFIEDQQAAILRAPTPVGEMIACLTGGHNDEQHNHNDLGHFSVWLGGERILPDLGSPAYTPSFFGSSRYNFLAASSCGHSCPIIGGYEQRPGRDVAGRMLEWAPAKGMLRLDLTAAYPPEAGLQHWTRELRREQLDGGNSRFIIVDDFVTREPATPLVHIVWSCKPPVVAEAGRVHLGRLCLRCTAARPLVQEVSADGHHLWAFRGQTLYRLEFHCDSGQDRRLRIETMLSA